jgi:hypothetical protein
MVHAEPVGHFIDLIKSMGCVIKAAFLLDRFKCLMKNRFRMDFFILCKKFTFVVSVKKYCFNIIVLFLLFQFEITRF